MNLATVMDGKALAQKMKTRVAQQVGTLSHPVRLAVILVGNNPASRIYVDGKKRDCIQCGIESEEHAMPETATQEQLLARIDILNQREDIDGILLQLPLPPQMQAQAALEAILPEKDVDCFHPFNVGMLFTGGGSVAPCTPAGILTLLQEYEIAPAGAHCVIVGRSNIVGKPMAAIMLAQNATVTVCHSHTQNLADECRRADILIAATGQRNLITADMVKAGAVVIDVSMNRDENGRLCGDVDFPAVREKAAYITPVPGGVGPMTRAMLMENTLQAAISRRKK